MKILIALLSLFLLFALNQVKAENQNIAVETVVMQTYDNAIVTSDAIVMNQNTEVNFSINRELKQIFLVDIPTGLNVELWGIKTDFGDNTVLNKFWAKKQATKELNIENKFIIAQKDYTEIGNSKSYLCSRYSVVYNNYSEKITTQEGFGSINKLLEKTL